MPKSGTNMVATLASKLVNQLEANEKELNNRSVDFGEVVENIRAGIAPQQSADRVAQSIANGMGDLVTERRNLLRQLEATPEYASAATMINRMNSAGTRSQVMDVVGSYNKEALERGKFLATEYLKVMERGTRERGLMMEADIAIDIALRAIADGYRVQGRGKE